MNGWRKGFGCALADAAVEAVALAHGFASSVGEDVAGVERLVALSAHSANLPGGDLGLPAGWIEPVDAFVSRLLQRLDDDGLSDDAFLHAADVALAEMPALLDAMNVEALGEALEIALGQAVLGMVESREQKAESRNWDAEIKAFAAQGAGIGFGPLAEAVGKLDRKTPVGATLNSAQWARVPLALRERAFFSARVESVRFLAEAQDRLRMRLNIEKESLANGKSAFVDRGSFIVDMRRIAEEEGIRTAGPGEEGSVRDIRSVRRLGLIFDQQTQQAQNFARWKMDHDADVLDEFPAYRLAPSTAENPREEEFWESRWTEAGQKVGWQGALQDDLVALKTSPIWRALSRFGTPWPPFDYGSQRDLEDVDRQEAEALGLLITPDAPVPSYPTEHGTRNTEWGGSGREFDGETGEAMGFNDALEASVAGWRDDEIATLTSAFGDQVKLKDGKVQWQGNLIGDLYSKALADPQFKDSINLGEATPYAVAKAGPLMDIDGFKMRLSADDIRYSHRRHGEQETRPDQRRLKRLDFEIAPHVWRSPDKVTFDEGLLNPRERSLQFRKTVMGEAWVIGMQVDPAQKQMSLYAMRVKK